MCRFGTAAVLAALALGAVASSARAQATTRVSLSSAGDQGNGSSYSPAISADGRFVAFHSFASNLVPGDTNRFHDVFVRDRWTGVTERVSVGSNGEEANGDCSHPSISANGRFVAFQSTASNLVPGDTNGTYDVFVHDRLTGATVQASADSAGMGGNARSSFPSISADGRLVAFSSVATNLVPGDTNNVEDIFVHDLQSGETVRASVASNGAQASAASILPALSADGRYVAFTSAAPDLSHYNYAGTFVRDLQANFTRQVREDTTGGAFSGTYPSISADGRYVAIQSLNSLVQWDTNGKIDIYVRDMPAFTTTIVSLRPDGTLLRDADSVRPTISADGRYVVFSTTSSEVVPNDNNGAGDVFLRDTRMGTTRLISANASGVSGTGCSGFCLDYGTAISEDACSIAFFGFASDLVAGDTNGFADVFVRDLQGGVPFALSGVVPATGSSVGNDVVHLLGCGFTSVADTRVRFSNVLATVTDVQPSRITVRTPPGIAGPSEVRVANARGTLSLSGAYSYLAPEAAALLGNVNEGIADREDVLTLNGSRGDDSRILTLGVGQPILLQMAAPTSLATARFVLYAWTHSPSAGTLTVLPRGLGTLVFPAPFTGGSPQPRAIFNNAGHRAVLGAPSLPSQPAPSIVLNLASGSPHAAVVTFQGIVQDAGSVIPEGWSVTNAIVLRVQ